MQVQCVDGNAVALPDRTKGPLSTLATRLMLDMFAKYLLSNILQPKHNTTCFGVESKVALFPGELDL